MEINFKLMIFKVQSLLKTLQNPFVKQVRVNTSCVGNMHCLFEYSYKTNITSRTYTIHTVYRTYIATLIYLLANQDVPDRHD